MFTHGWECLCFGWKVEESLFLSQEPSLSCSLPPLSPLSLHPSLSPSVMSIKLKASLSGNVSKQKQLSNSSCGLSLTLSLSISVSLSLHLVWMSLSLPLSFFLFLLAVCHSSVPSHAFCLFALQGKLTEQKNNNSLMCVFCVCLVKCFSLGWYVKKIIGSNRATWCVLVHGKTTMGQKIHSKWHQRSSIVLVCARFPLPYNNANLIKKNA